MQALASISSHRLRASTASICGDVVDVEQRLGGLDDAQRGVEVLGRDLRDRGLERLLARTWSHPVPVRAAARGSLFGPGVLVPYPAKRCSITAASSPETWPGSGRRRRRGGRCGRGGTRPLRPASASRGRRGGRRGRRCARRSGPLHASRSARHHNCRGRNVPFGVPPSPSRLLALMPPRPRATGTVRPPAVSQPRRGSPAARESGSWTAADHANLFDKRLKYRNFPCRPRISGCRARCKCLFPAITGHSSK